MENVIEIEHLNKSYGEVKAVQDLSFLVKRGELFAFLGVNGAGKSTTISMICGQLKRDPALTQQRVHAGISVRTGGIFPDRKAVNAVIFLDDGYSSPALLECDVQNFFASSGLP